MPAANFFVSASTSLSFTVVVVVADARATP